MATKTRVNAPEYVDKKIHDHEMDHVRKSLDNAVLVDVPVSEPYEKPAGLWDFVSEPQPKALTYTQQMKVASALSHLLVYLNVKWDRKRNKFVDGNDVV